MQSIDEISVEPMTLFSQVFWLENGRTSVQEGCYCCCLKVGCPSKHPGDIFEETLGCFVGAPQQCFYTLFAASTLDISRSFMGTESIYL